MAYMSYARLRGIQAPTTFAKEFLMQKPSLIMLSLWCIGFTIFTITELLSGIIDFTASIDYSPLYLQCIIDIFMWFTPMVLIAVFSIKVFIELRKRDQKKRQIKIRHKSTTTTAMNKNKTFHISATIKFQILIFTYWIQWFIPCVVDILQPCNCIPKEFYSTLYWLTYSVCTLYYTIT